jgi:pimeloyl-ACP methyl ester carboxylesterase
MSENNIIRLKDGRRLGYAEYGDPKGKPLFFFHGFPTSRFHAKRLDQAAKKLKIRVIAPDRPGFGLSDFKGHRTLLDFPRDVLELADYLKIKKFAVVGVSGGGPYAAACAFKISDRLTKVGIVVGLAPTYVPGICQGMYWMAKFGWENYQKFPILIWLAGFLGWIQTQILHLDLSYFTFFAPADKKLLNKDSRKLAFKGKQEAFRHGFKGAMLDLQLYTSDWGFDLRKIKVPVYLFYGSIDKNVSLKMGQYYASQIPNSHLTVYPNEGHLCQVTHAEEILNTLVN